MTSASLTTKHAPSTFWSNTAHVIVIICVLGFLALTTLGMGIYPGGTDADRTTVGYRFFTNYFSDLGRTVARNGAPNGIASSLFTLAMTCAGSGLALFFIAFAQRFVRPRWVHIVSQVGMVLGILAGACFIGVGLTPSNLYGPPHQMFTLGGFVMFFLTTVLFIAAIAGSRNYPHRAVLIFILFAILLAAYIWLQFKGPRGRTFDATLIQATGQKAIVYASVLSVLVQALVARQVNHAQDETFTNGRLSD